MNKISNALIYWYLSNKRELPWRLTTNPYNIWLSEIILQQTRVAQGLPYYLKFTKYFPTIIDLAHAEEQQVLKLWQGLGYYSRARNLHYTAKYVAFSLGGKFPKDYQGLKKLKGVGDYTASAIASICFGEPTPVVDGNVYRFLSRYFAIETPIDSSQGVKQFKQLASQLIDPKQAGNFNQAIMEFGAQQCKPMQPNCVVCPVKNNCKALEINIVAKLPIKLKKQSIKQRSFNYIVFVSSNQKTIFQQRTQKGIWYKLYEFPLIEQQSLTPNKLSKHPILNGIRVDKIEKHNKKPIIHKLTHQQITATFWIVYTKKLSEKAIPIQKLKQHPTSVLIDNFLNEFDFTNAFVSR